MPQQCAHAPQLVDATPLTCKLAYVVPATRSAAAAGALIVLASFVPWLHLSFWGRTLGGMLQELHLADAVARSEQSLMRLVTVSGLAGLTLVGYGAHLVRHIIDTEFEHWRGGPAAEPLLEA